MLSLLQPFAVRFAVRTAGFIDKYKSINPQTAVNWLPTAGKLRIIYRQTIVSISKHCYRYWIAVLFYMCTIDKTKR